MRVSTSAIILSAVYFFLTGCSPNERPMEYQLGTTRSLVMGGNLRMVTERDREIRGAGVFPTVCTEPSPDVAIAFGKELSASAKINNPSGISGEGEGSYKSTEVATALAGRTAGVLALRDGLYAACQAYANGVIGHNAYAIILSQYGNLLVALAGTEKAAQTTSSKQDDRLAAVLVTCISEYDQTRIGAPYHLKDRAANPWLNRLCDAFLANLKAGRVLKVPPGAPKSMAELNDKEQKSDPKPTSVVTEKIASTKTPTTIASKPAAGAPAGGAESGK
jgi:hypothetical protein